jgi:GNAT superfamily N-acetyltransferase
VTKTQQAPAVTVQRARPEHAPTIAALHVAAWREIYTGILPDEMISALTVEVRRAWWAQLLSTPPETPGGAAYLAALDGAPVGFGTCNGQRSDALAAAGFDGEISSLYVLRAAQGRGVGQAMMARMATRLQRAGYRAAGLWVLRESEANRRFYEGCGGTLLDGAAGIRRQGRFTEVAYGWPDLAMLTALVADGALPSTGPRIPGTPPDRAA